MADPWIKMLAEGVYGGLEIGKASLDSLRFSDEVPARPGRVECLYIVRAGDSGWTKVGKTASLDSRLRALQCGCPFPILYVGHYTAEGRGSNQWGPIHCLERGLHQTLEEFGFARGAGKDWFQVPGAHVCHVVNALIRQHRTDRGLPMSFNPENEDA